MKIAPPVVSGITSLLLCSWQASAQETPSQPPGHSAATSDLLRWPLATTSQKYAAIDGKRMWHYVLEQAKIAEDFRDHGHPQFRGRNSGTSSDEADAQWLLDKYRQN